MSERDEQPVRDTGPKHEGPQRTSPYAVSRLAPRHDLVDIARQIQEADLMLGAVAHGRLTTIAAQMKALKAEAERILDETRHALDLHRARCSFAKRPGGVYHCYQRTNGERWLSLIGPGEWGEPSAERVFVGTYRLELDQGWTALAGDRAGDATTDADDVPAPRELVARLLGG